MSAFGFSRLATSVSCGPENAVFMNSALAPSLEHATTASIQPRWLRHMIGDAVALADPVLLEGVRERVRALVDLP